MTARDRLSSRLQASSAWLAWLVLCYPLHLRCVLIGGVLCTGQVPVFAGKNKMDYKKVTISYVKDNAMQPNAKKFEIALPNVNANLISATADGFTVVKMGTQKGGDFRLEITKNAGTIADMEQITVKITGLDKAKVSPGKPIWSAANGALIGTTDNSSVTASDIKGDPIYSVINEMTPSSDIFIGELRLYYNHDPVDPDAADPLVWIPNPSFIVTSRIDLLGFGANEEFVVPNILDGKRFIAQGRIVDSSDVVIGAFIDSYYVPEPSTYALLMAGGGLVLVTRRWRRNAASHQAG